VLIGMLELLIMQQVQEQQLPHQEDFLIHLNLLSHLINLHLSLPLEHLAFSHLISFLLLNFLALLLKEIKDHQPQVQELVQALVLIMIRPEPIML